MAATDKRLAWLTREIAAIPHVRRLRVHTRLPVVIPQRVTSELIAALCDTRLPVSMVLHCNHANEIDDQLGAAIQRLKKAGILLLNQAVLLKGVNDNIEDLVSLSETLGDHGIMPYYLHVLDHVKGAQHFHVDDRMATGLAAELLARLPGFLVPRLVREIAGEASKTPLPARPHAASRLA